MGAIALSVHHARPGATELGQAGHRLGRRPRARGPHRGLRRRRASGDPTYAWASSGCADGLDLAVSLGGDGTMLRTVDLLSDAGVPVLGVNVGHLGYLTVVEPVELEQALDRFFAGDHLIDERMLLAVTVDAPSWIERRAAHLPGAERDRDREDARSATRCAWRSRIDGAVLHHLRGRRAHRGDAHRLDRLRLLGTRPDRRRPASAPSRSRPVSPHMLFDRTLVLKPTTTVRLDVLGPRPATLVGRRPQPRASSSRATAWCAPPADQPARLVTFERRDFHRILKSKFGLNDR